METILLVEDDQATRLSLELLLANEGYRVLSAASGVEALADLGVRGADLIVTDWSMPHTDGVRLCKNLRADSVFRSMPVVMVSADADSDAGETLWDAFFRKPFDIPDLLKTIRALLDERRSEGAAEDAPPILTSDFHDRRRRAEPAGQMCCPTSRTTTREMGHRLGFRARRGRKEKGQTSSQAPSLKALRALRNRPGRAAILLKNPRSMLGERERRPGVPVAPAILNAVVRCPADDRLRCKTNLASLMPPFGVDVSLKKARRPDKRLALQVEPGCLNVSPWVGRAGQFARSDGVELHPLVSISRTWYASRMQGRKR
jgi:DNA-binding response OmpR family regulator